MITIPVILFVGPSRLVSMLDVGKHDDIDEIARTAATTFPDIIYWFAEMVIDAPKPEFWPELEIEWMNWYGKIVTNNLYAYFPGADLVNQQMFTEAEIKWFLANHPTSGILFVHNKESS